MVAKRYRIFELRNVGGSNDHDSPVLGQDGAGEKVLVVSTQATEGSLVPYRRRFSLWRLIALAVVSGSLALAGVLAMNNVPVSLSDADIKSIPELLNAAGKPHLTRNIAVGRSFTDQAEIVSEVQAAVLAIAPKTDPIDFDRGREPQDLLELRYGLCYDRSRVIEKILTYVGLESRHVAIYSLKKASSTIAALLTARTSSHAVTEVLTQNGWMAIDPDIPWIGLTDDLEVLSIRKLQKAAGKKNYKWSPLAKKDFNDIFDSKFTYVTGLYSRHGRFYAPYNSIPDINYPQLASGLYELVLDR